MRYRNANGGVDSRLGELTVTTDIGGNVTAEQRVRAALRVAADARDAEDCGRLLNALFSGADLEALRAGRGLR